MGTMKGAVEGGYGFTRDNTQAVKGIAILFLLAYHLFSRDFRFRGFDVQFWPIPKESAMYYIFNMQICVGMFIFLTAYGLTLSLKKQFKDYEFTNQQATLFAIKRYLGLFFMFLLPFVFCQILTKVLGISRYGEGRLEKLGGFVLDLFGVSNIFGTQMMIDTWWYMSLAVVVTVFMPVCVRIYKRYGWLFAVMVLFGGSFFLETNVNLTKWLLAVPVAVCFADRQVLERMKAWQIGRNYWVSKLIKFMIFTPLLLALFYVRTSDWGRANLEFAMNGIVSVAFICWCHEFILEIPVLKQVLELIGRHSGDIFYVHNFIRGVWFRKFTYSFGNAVVIFLFLLVSSLAISVFLDFIRKVFRYSEITRKITEKILRWAESVL